jgi:hypothetical protein
MMSLALAIATGSLALGMAPPPEEPAGIEVADITITRSFVLRIPARRSRAASAPKLAPPAYRERKGPKCIDASRIGGAAVTAPDSVDVMLRGGERLRARLEDECPALDYYSGFYVRPGADGKICADRDSIRTRSGGDCQIDRFRVLTPIDGH